MIGIEHPVNDASLVSYHRPELLRIMPELELTYDCWTLLNSGGRGESKQKYLKQEPAEPKKAYQSRLERSTYTPIFRDAIQSYAGLLSRFQLMDAPPSLLTAEKNIDLQGSSIQTFMNICDELALRDGGAFIMVDIMPATGANNFFDQMNDGRLPYLISIKRSDVINWSVTYERGREVIQQATVRQLRSVPDGTGFGTTVEPIYYVLRPGIVQMYRLVKESGGGGQKWSNQLVDEVQTSLPIVPIVWYGATTNRFAQGDIPLSGLAELSIQHFQMRSDLIELLHKCAMPVPVRKGASVGPDGKPAPLIIGPNTAIDLSGEPGSGFEFAEPSGKSLERHQAEITHLEALMDRCSLNFLYGANIKTATEASLRASQVASSVSSLVRNKTSAFDMIMRLWAFYAGETASITSESGIAINDSLINKPLGASEMAQLVNLYKENLLSRQTVLDELQRGGVLDPDMKINDEIRRIEEDHTANLDQTIQDAQLMQEAQPQAPQPQASQASPSETQRVQSAAQNAQ